MHALECLLTRRSIRKYAETPVDPSLIEELIKYAMYAPSAANTQPWQFIAINDRKILQSIRTFHPYSRMLDTAPLAVLICGDESLEYGPGYMEMDCSAATQNLLLAAHAHGLGSVWMGIHPVPERIAGMRRLTGLPETLHPISLVVLGYPSDELPTTPERYKQERIHWNQY